MVLRCSILFIVSFAAASIGSKNEVPYRCTAFLDGLEYCDLGIAMSESPIGCPIVADSNFPDDAKAVCDATGEGGVFVLWLAIFDEQFQAIWIAFFGREGQ